MYSGQGRLAHARGCLRAICQASRKRATYSHERLAVNVRACGRNARSWGRDAPAPGCTIRIGVCRERTSIGGRSASSLETRPANVRLAQVGAAALPALPLYPRFSARHSRDISGELEKFARRRAPRLHESLRSSASELGNELAWRHRREYLVIREEGLRQRHIAALAMRSAPRQ